MSSQEFSLEDYSFHFNGKSGALYVIHDAVTDSNFGAAQYRLSVENGAPQNYLTVEFQWYEPNPQTLVPMLKITDSAYSSETGNMLEPLDSGIISTGYTGEENWKLGSGDFSLNYVEATTSEGMTIKRMVLPGIGVTFIEATDPIFSKVFQFGLAQKLYIVPFTVEGPRQLYTTKGVRVYWSLA